MNKKAINPLDDLQLEIDVAGYAKLKNISLDEAEWEIREILGDVLALPKPAE